MATELEELLQFLSSPSPQVKKAAVDIVKDLTGSEDGLQALAHYSQIVLPSLSRLLGEKEGLGWVITSDFHGNDWHLGDIHIQAKKYSNEEATRKSVINGTSAKRRDSGFGS